MRASTNSLEVCWVATPTAQAYVLEVQKLEVPPPAQPAPVNTVAPFVKKIQNVNSPQIVSVGGNDAIIKEPILSPKAQTPTAIRLTSPPNAAVNTPISFAVATSPISSVQATTVSGQPIIISSPTQTLTSHQVQQSKATIKGVVTNPTIQQQQQGVRLVNTSTSNVRVISSGQTVRLTTQGGGVGQQLNTTILRQQPTIITNPTSSGSVSGGQTIGTKQIIVQKPISLSGQNLLQLVKTSTGMTVQLPKVNVQQKSGIGGTLQQLPAGSQIVSSGINNQGKTALIGTNVVKLMSPAAVGGNKILMKNSNLVQVGKMSTAAGKPAFVITNKQGQPIRTNQQIIFVTTASGIRTVQTGSVVSSSGNTYVSLVSSPQVNTISSVMAGTTSGTPSGTMKVIRGVAQQGRGSYVNCVYSRLFVHSTEILYCTVVQLAKANLLYHSLLQVNR